jgi:hypothetical protein
VPRPPGVGCLRHLGRRKDSEGRPLLLPDFEHKIVHRPSNTLTSPGCAHHHLDDGEGSANHGFAMQAANALRVPPCEDSHRLLELIDAPEARGLCAVPHRSHEETAETRLQWPEERLHAVTNRSRSQRRGALCPGRLPPSPGGYGMH